MKTIDETFKTEKEMLEDFFKNRKIYTIRKAYFNRLCRTCNVFKIFW